MILSSETGKKRLVAIYQSREDDSMIDNDHISVTSLDTIDGIFLEIFLVSQQYSQSHDIHRK